MLVSRSGEGPWCALHMDGDSSIHPTHVQIVLGWGNAIKKMECANHACKCYRSGPVKLAPENSSYRGKDEGWTDTKNV